jgi:hypothetical protein
VGPSSASVSCPRPCRSTPTPDRPAAPGARTTAGTATTGTHHLRSTKPDAAAAMSSPARTGLPTDLDNDLIGSNPWDSSTSNCAQPSTSSGLSRRCAPADPAGFRRHAGGRSLLRPAPQRIARRPCVADACSAGRGPNGVRGVPRTSSSRRASPRPQPGQFRSSPPRFFQWVLEPRAQARENSEARRT